MIRVAYNNQKQPPAPFVLATLSNPLDGRCLSDVPAQLDTAADRTLVPMDLLQSLGLQPIDDILIGGLGGFQESMPLFAAAISIFTLPPQTLSVVGHPGEPWILIGRDILNLHRLILDGPNLTLEIHSEAS